MRLPFGYRRFDYLFNLFTSFGYFRDDAQNEDVIFNVAQAVAPSGKIIVDHANIPFALERLVRFGECEKDGVRFFIERWTDERFIYKQITVNDPGAGAPHLFTEQIRRYGVNDFKRLFALHRFRLQETFGSYRLDACSSKESPRLIMIFTGA